MLNMLVAKDPSVSDLARVFRAFELVDESDGLVFGGDAAVPLLIGDERVAAEAEFSGALAGLDEGCGREVSPGEVGFAKGFRASRWAMATALYSLGRWPGR